MNPEMIEQLEQCAGVCAETASWCERCAAHCLTMGGEHQGLEHQRMLRDAADACAFASRLVDRDSEFLGEACRVCAAVCRHCAESCERLGEGDPVMERCAEMCRVCEQVCEDLVEAGGGAVGAMNHRGGMLSMSATEITMTDLGSDEQGSSELSEALGEDASSGQDVDTALSGSEEGDESDESELSSVTGRDDDDETRWQGFR